MAILQTFWGWRSFIRKEHFIVTGRLFHYLPFTDAEELIPNVFFKKFKDNCYSNFVMEFVKFTAAIFSFDGFIYHTYSRNHIPL